MCFSLINSAVRHADTQTRKKKEKENGFAVIIAMLMLMLILYYFISFCFILFRFVIAFWRFIFWVVRSHIYSSLIMIIIIIVYYYYCGDMGIYVSKNATRARTREYAHTDAFNAHEYSMGWILLPHVNGEHHCPLGSIRSLTN